MRITLACLMVVLLAPVLFGTEPDPGEPAAFSLREIQEYALRHSRDTRAARLDVIRSKRTVWETTAIGLPQVDATVSYQNYPQIPTTLLPALIFDADAKPGTFTEVRFGTQHNARMDVTATQILFQGSYLVGLQAARVFLQLSRDQLRQSEITIKETVARTYFLILLSERTREILLTSLENLKKTLYETRELYKAGFAEDTDVDQLQLAVTDLQDQAKSTDVQIRITYNLLKYQMGFDLNEVITLSDDLDGILAFIDTEELLSSHLDLENHADFQTADTREKAQNLLLRREQSAYLPSVSAYITHSRNAQRDKFDFFAGGKWFASTVIGVNIQIPVWSSGMRRARVQQARLDLEKARLDKEHLSRGLQLGLMQARADFSNALDKRESTRRNVDLAQRMFRKTREKFQNGTATSLELTQAHNQYLTAETRLTNAVVDLLNAKLELEKSLSRI